MVITFSALASLIAVATVAGAVDLTMLPWGICYAGAFSVSAIGLLRVGKRAFIVLSAASMIAFAPAILGLTLFFDADLGWKFVRLSTYLFWGVALLGVAFVLKGWRLYATDLAPS